MGKFLQLIPPDAWKFTLKSCCNWLIDREEGIAGGGVAIAKLQQQSNL